MHSEGNADGGRERGFCCSDGDVADHDYAVERNDQSECYATI
jgi:hypothetical protein